MRPKNSVPQFRIEAGGSRISPNDLKPWGELRGHVAWSILCFAETGCKDREAKLKLLEASADDIIDIVRKWATLPLDEALNSGHWRAISPPKDTDQDR